MVFLGLMLIGFGITTWFYPEKTWKFTIGWTTDDGTEPSDSYILYLKTLSVIFIFIGSMGTAVSFFG
ncbi:DUF6199 family natural product biosynthesis protein [Paenibacillus albicereus]|uniref:DUF6199 family natural product biosynthesis protein n=1 Tax=Paenibacillus albicereus TaxID=2726185 RepID=UPI0038B2FE30